jgi:hypothetical protein
LEGRVLLDDNRPQGGWIFLPKNEERQSRCHARGDRHILLKSSHSVPKGVHCTRRIAGLGISTDPAWANKNASRTADVQGCPVREPSVEVPVDDEIIGRNFGCGTPKKNQARQSDNGLAKGGCSKECEFHKLGNPGRWVSFSIVGGIPL